MRWLVGLSYSPWTMKARWALEHHAVPHRFVEYVSMLGEPLLRLATRQLRGRVSVPVLIEKRRVLTDSYAIARHAEAIGDGRPLFPRGSDADIERWNERSERALAAGRALVTLRIREDPEALAEMVPRPIRAVAPPLAVPLARLGARFLERKYDMPLDVSDLRAQVEGVLEELRTVLSGGRETILAGFTYADIAMWPVLQFVSPSEHRRVRLGSAAARAWRDTVLASEYSDLLAWRDSLVERHGRSGRRE